jgi:hypothetical protein
MDAFGADDDDLVRCPRARGRPFKVQFAQPPARRAQRNCA